MPIGSACRQELLLQIMHPETAVMVWTLYKLYGNCASEFVAFYAAGGKPWNRRQSCKFWFSGNSKPKALSIGNLCWRRLAVRRLQTASWCWSSSVVSVVLDLGQWDQIWSGGFWFESNLALSLKRDWIVKGVASRSASHIEPCRSGENPCVYRWKSRWSLTGVTPSSSAHSVRTLMP